MTRHAPLVALAIATITSVGGTRLSAIAIPWLVLTTTNSPMLTGLVGFAEMLPYVLAKAFSGPFIDRLGARRLSIWCDYLSAAAVSVIPFLFLAGLLNIWMLLAAVALLGVVRAPADAAKQALVPTSAEEGKFSLERVTGVLGTSNRLAGTLGAAGAGLLIAWLGAGSALLANSVVFALSALSLGLGLRGERFLSPAIKAGDAGTYFTQMGEGWKVFVADPVLVALVVMLAFTGLFDQAYATVLLPVWVRSSGLDASWVGILLAVFSGAAIFGAAIAAIYAERLPRLTLYIAGFIFAGPVPMAILTLEVPMPVIVGTLLFSGFSAGFLNPIVGALLFERIPKPLVGRIVALVGSLTWALIPFGGVYAGLLVENAGIAFALGLTAFLYLVAAMSPTAVPHFRAIGTRSALKPSDAR